MTSSRKTTLPLSRVTTFKNSLVSFLAALHVSRLLPIISYLTKKFHQVLHELRLIHTDLKPENILLVRNDYRVVHIPIPGKVRLLLHVSNLKHY